MNATPESGNSEAELDSRIQECWNELARSTNRSFQEDVLFAIRSFGNRSAEYRAAAVRVAKSWLSVGDESQRYAAREFAREYGEIELAPDIRALVQRLDSQTAELRRSRSAEVPFELFEERRVSAWILEALEDPTTFKERRQLGDALEAYWESDLPPDPYSTELLRPHARLCDFHWSLKKAVPLIRGASVNQSQFGPDEELRESLEVLVKSERDELRDEAQACLDHYLVCEQLSLIARDIANP